MIRLATIAATALLAGFVGSAHAADMPMPAPMIVAPTPKLIPAEIGSNWYIRGDVGYTMYNTPSASYGANQDLNEKFDDAFMIGAGIGYQFNSWLRADLTVDWRAPSDFFSNTVCCGGLSNEYSKIAVGTAMLNGYVDLGSWYGFTPYVGAGAGLAALSVSDYRGYNPPGFALSTTFGDHTQYNFAWALMGGVSYDMSKNSKLDLGYRYLNLGDARTKVDGTGVAVKYKDLQAHEVRVGFRYMID